MKTQRSPCVDCACVSCSFMFYSLRPHRLQPSRLLCPWDFPGNNTVVGSHSLLQGIFLTKGRNPGLPHCSQILYCLSHQEALCRLLAPFPPQIAPSHSALWSTNYSWFCFPKSLSVSLPPITISILCLGSSFLLPLFWNQLQVVSCDLLLSLPSGITVLYFLLKCLKTAASYIQSGF